MRLGEPSQLATAASYDLAIVGAGPAGCAAAIVAAEAGARVALIDEARDTSRLPGETLHPGVETVFARLGVREAMIVAAKIRPPGIFVRWGGDPSFQPYGGPADDPWRGFQIRRSDLLRVLRDRAAALGATMMFPARAGGLWTVRGEGWTVETSLGPLNTRMIVDASGARSWLGRRLGHPVETLSPPLVAFFGWTSTGHANRYFHPTLDGDREGWTWHAQIDDAVCAWVRLRTATSKGDRARGEGCSASRGAVVTWRRSGGLAGPGYLKVGDAALRLDPASSHGVLRALVTGATASLAALQALSSAEPASVFAAFGEWMESWAAREVARLSALYTEIGIDVRLG